MNMLFLIVVLAVLILPCQAQFGVAQPVTREYLDLHHLDRFQQHQESLAEMRKQLMRELGTELQEFTSPAMHRHQQYYSLEQWMGMVATGALCAGLTCILYHDALGIERDKKEGRIAALAAAASKASESGKDTDVSSVESNMTAIN
ncbi:hypothetical protein MPSEU_000977100 [Mayamaea pseudoterrestris]|nr:hypothetical protein MPSEU_000977100 [Mayamaea pseudoterrestris]